MSAAVAAVEQHRAFVIAFHRDLGVLLLRAHKKRKGDHYQLPGGRVDAAEIETHGLEPSFAHAAARELFEETGLRVDRARLAPVRDGAGRPLDMSGRRFFVLELGDADARAGDDCARAQPECPFRLRLSREHTGFCFARDAAEAVEMVRPHSGGRPSQALALVFPSLPGLGVGPGVGRGAGRGAGLDADATSAPREASEDGRESQRPPPHDDRARDVEIDLYATLGARASASPEELRRRFHALSRALHPDKNPSADAKPRFEAVLAAWDTLRDPGARAAYDRERAEARQRELAAAAAPVWAEVAVSAMELGEASDEDEPAPCYSYRCRCGDAFEVLAAELDEGCELVPCRGCSLQIRVRR